MKCKICLLFIVPFLVACSISPSVSKKTSKSEHQEDTQKSSDKDTYDDKGRLELNIKNLYFDVWQGEDAYTEIINNKFKVKIKPTNYDWSTWDEQVIMSINSNNIPDAFNFNLTSYNFSNTYLKWAKENIIKPLPDNLDKWPNLKQLINNSTNVDYLKVDGKLYGIPIANDISNPEKDFSNYTYVYRRDWAKQIDEKHANEENYVPVYKEGDVYTWEEFNRLLSAFTTDIRNLSGNNAASTLVDENLSFPSIANYYANSLGSFTKNNQGKAICNYTSDNYIAGLDVAKSLVDDKIYSQDQYNFVDGKANELYLAGQAAILYNNFSYANYLILRKRFKQVNKNIDLNDGTALLKVKGPDGNFAIKGIENWYSMTMFNSEISDNKLSKILDILDYLLSDEGTRLAIYGQENYDYQIVESGDYDYQYGDYKIKLNPDGWEKGSDGQYGLKTNGAKYLRYMATLGNDTKSFDPYTDLETYSILNNWLEDMSQAKKNNTLRVLSEPADIAYMSTPFKDDKLESLMSDGSYYVLKYCFNKISIDEYKAAFNENERWQRILQEINNKL